MGSDWELNAPASLELGLDEGADGVGGEEHDYSEDEPVEEVGAGVSQLFTDGLDVHLRNGREINGVEPTDATDLAPLASRVNDRVLQVDLISTMERRRNLRNEPRRGR